MESSGHKLEFLLNKCISDENWKPRHLEFYCVNSDSLSGPEGLGLGLATALGIFQYKNKTNKNIEHDILKILNLAYNINDKDKYNKKIDEIVLLVEKFVATHIQ